MIHKNNLLTILLISGLVFFNSCKIKEERLPDIVYILADDMGSGDLGCLNPESAIPTPHMDRIAANGMTFSDAHSPSAVCTPTRYGVLTGRYCFRTRLKSGVLTGYSAPLLEEDRLTVADVLKNAGYATACIGKWHLGLNWPRKDTTLPLLTGGEWNPESTNNVDYQGQISGGPADHGFDYSFIIPASLDMTPYVYIRNHQLISPVDGFTEGQDQPRGVFWRPGDLQQEFDIQQVLKRLTAEAVSYIENRSGEPEPFFLYFPLTAPHTPWLPEEEFQGKSEAGIYGDFVNQVDHTIGQIISALEVNGRIQNTLLIVTSDNGAHWTPDDKALFDHRANFPFSGMKSDAWEGGHHIPFILQWPDKVPMGTVSNQLTTLTDLFATVADLTGFIIPANAGEDSYSMLPAILGQEIQPIRPNAVHHSINGMFAIRMGEFKLIDGQGSGGWSAQGNPEDPKGQLYNIRSDQEEQHNLYSEMPDMVEKLSRELDRIKASGRSNFNTNNNTINQ